MKIYNSYILSTALLLLLTTVILVALGQNSIDIYYSIYIMEALILTELYVYFSANVTCPPKTVPVIMLEKRKAVKRGNSDGKEGLYTRTDYPQAEGS